MSKSNFSFLEQKWPDAFKSVKMAESIIIQSPEASAILVRKTLENLLKSVISSYSSSNSSSFLKDSIDLFCRDEKWYKFKRNLHDIREKGNSGAHRSTSITIDMAQTSLKQFFEFSVAFAGIDKSLDFDNKYLAQPDSLLSEEKIKEFINEAFENILNKADLSIKYVNQTPRYTTSASINNFPQPSLTEDQVLKGFDIFMYYETNKKNPDKKWSIAEAKAKLELIGWPERDAHLSFQPFRNLQSGMLFTRFGNSSNQQFILRTFINRLTSDFGEEAKRLAINSLKATVHNNTIKGYQTTRIEQLLVELDT